MFSFDSWECTGFTNKGRRLTLPIQGTNSTIAGTRQLRIYGGKNFFAAAQIIAANCCFRGPPNMVGAATAWMTSCIRGCYSDHVGICLTAGF